MKNGQKLEKHKEGPRAIIQCKLLKMVQLRGWRDSTKDRALALQVADPNSISGIPYGMYAPQNQRE